MIVTVPADGTPVRSFLEEMRKAINRNSTITGDDDSIVVSDDVRGKKITFREKDGALLHMMFVMDVAVDHLECRHGTILVDDDKVSGVVMSEETVYVAKPFALQKTPWHNTINDDNETITFRTINGEPDGTPIMDERIVENKEMPAYGMKTERIHPAYGTNRATNTENQASKDGFRVWKKDSKKWPEMIMACEPSEGTGMVVTHTIQEEKVEIIDEKTGETAVTEQAIVVKTTVTWQDINMDGRHWIIPNIIPNFPETYAHKDDTWDFRRDSKVGATIIRNVDQFTGTVTVPPYRGLDTDRKNNGWDYEPVATPNDGEGIEAGGTYSGLGRVGSDIFEGSEDPDMNGWRVDEQPVGFAGMKIPIMTRWVYKHEGEETLIGFSRLFMFDVTGRLFAVGPETRFEIEIPEIC